MRKPFSFLIAVAVTVGVTASSFGGSMTLLGVGGAPSAAGLMLDGITSGIKAAYSTRKLLTAYAGNAVQIQRASDNATSNVGFVSNVLDTATTGTFCSGTTCRVITWYDQSGGGFNLTQATFANAPIIFQAGATVFINSTRPALTSVFTVNTFLANTSLSANPVNTLYVNAVAAFNNQQNSGIVGGSGAANNFYFRVDVTTVKSELLASNTSSLATSSVAGVTTGSIYEVQYNTGSGGTLWVDSTSAGTPGAHAFAGGSTFQAFEDGASLETGDMKIGELVMYDLVGGIPSGSRTAIEANQKAYWGTP
jgi:Alpha-L-arabinofuranosidase B, catalytic